MFPTSFLVALFPSAGKKWQVCYLTQGIAPLIMQLAITSLEGSLQLILFSWLVFANTQHFKAKVQNHSSPYKNSRISSILGCGCASLMVMSLNPLYSIQNRCVPSFFFAMTMAVAHGLVDCRIMPCSTICWTCCPPPARQRGFAGRMRFVRAFQWQGSQCYTRMVWPWAFSYCVKMPW